MVDKDNTHYLWSTLLRLIYVVLVVIIVLLFYIPLKPHIDAYINRPQYSKEQLKEFASRRSTAHADIDRVENGIHVSTGMVYDENFQHIKASCLSCHSPKLITQNRATRSGWKDMIAWMQDSQGLPDLGYREPMILDYLAEHYAPKNEGRRKNLDMQKIKWYILNPKN